MIDNIVIGVQKARDFLADPKTDKVVRRVKNLLLLALVAGMLFDRLTTDEFHAAVGALGL